MNLNSISELINNEIQESELDEDSKEVTIFIAGYICRKLLKKLKCELCTLLIKSDVVDIDAEYIDLVSRGGLLTPSKLLASHVVSCFAMLDAVKQSLLTLETHKKNNTI